MALARLERGEIVGAALTAAFQTDRRINDSVYVGSYTEYTDAERAQLLDGIEQIAREGRRGDEMTAFKARTAAFTALNIIATGPGIMAPQAREVPRRLLRIYQQAPDREGKNLAIASLGPALRTSPSESPEIIELLVSLIKQPVVTRESVFHGVKQYATEPVEPEDALDALFDACEVGVPILRQLYADRDAIPDDETRARLEQVAENGFDPKTFELSTGWPQPCSDVPPHLQGRR